ncbi:mechanosensitive ion channel family protein [Neisseria leonii]|uniref:mechanosensitive ion channel family protein n=1 Tax=Neisseria leonii TaxID=2995413 RepID=UPI00237B5B9D|nr:mechanosensitive ion channel domain-containing protein [Neisseria sp. 3986]MDD9325597.1 mechanosensitive ion channel [Neisseria sp. 3986]
MTDSAAQTALSGLPNAAGETDKLLFQSGLADFFVRLFTPQEFTSRLLERSFSQTLGWVELALMLGLMAAAWWLSGIVNSRFVRNDISGWPHIVRRLMWPVLMLAAALLAVFVWNTLGLRAVWLRFLILSANWMILIRLIMAVLHTALPAHRLSGLLERTVSALLWVSFLAWVSGLDDMIVNWMKNLSIPLGSAQLSLWMVFTGILWVSVIMVLAMWLAKLVQRRLIASAHLDPSLKIMLSNIVGIVFGALAILIALPIVGIDLTVLSVFGGALGVGIGFGLQKIASNYISGFMILGDRSIRPGDRLTVNGFTGYVTKISARFVVLRSATGAEALIPNETFVTNTVINESYTSKALWQGLDIQVSYDSDIVRAMEIMVEAAKKQERVDQEKAPSAVLTNFGADGIDLRVGFWVKDPENGFAGLFSAILIDIWHGFNAEGIDFPYPQREIRILQNEEKPDAASIQKAAAKARESTYTDPAVNAGLGDANEADRAQRAASQAVPAAPAQADSR